MGRVPAEIEEIAGQQQPGPPGLLGHRKIPQRRQRQKQQKLCRIENHRYSSSNLFWLPLGGSWLREAQTEGETSKLTATKSQALSATRFAGLLTQPAPLSLRDISPRCGELPSQRGPFAAACCFFTRKFPQPGSAKGCNPRWNSIPASGCRPRSRAGCGKRPCR